MTTFARLVTMVREESGHAISASQGVNALETIKYLVERTQYELWTAFEWPQLITRWDIPVSAGQVEFAYPAEVTFDQIRKVFWYLGDHWHLMEFGIPEDAILPLGAVPTRDRSTTAQFWDTYYNPTANQDRIRLWPMPNSDGVLRLRGQRKLLPMVDDDSVLTLDAALVALYVSYELLTRAKSGDAELKKQKADRHLKELLGNKISAKNRMTTFGATRHRIHDVTSFRHL